MSVRKKEKFYHLGEILFINIFLSGNIGQELELKYARRKKRTLAEIKSFRLILSYATL